MRKVAIWACLIVMLAGVAIAATGESSPMKVTGQVISVDVGANELTVAVEISPGQSRDVMFEVGPETKILKANEPITLAEVRAGDRVDVSYHAVAGKNKAVTIGVEPKAA